MSERTMIVVGVDDTPSSEAAIRYAADMADRFGDGLELVHVVPQAARTGGLYAVVPAYFDDIGRSILRTAADRARALAGGEGVETDLRHGMRVPTLLKGTERARAIVLGFDAHPTLERLATGSTVMGVAMRAHVPVIVVPPSWSAAQRRGAVTVGIKSIEGSSALLRHVFELASGRGARLRVVHAWAMPGGYDDAVVARAHGEEVSEDLTSRLRAAVATVAAEHPDVTYEVAVVHGHPARVLATASADSDLLLLERRRHSFLGTHLGATARALIRAGECPVVIVPADEPTGERADVAAEIRAAATSATAASV